MTLPLTLVTGFLGSGKTTCLNHLASTHAGRSLMFVVNEFGKVDIDGARLGRDLKQVVPIPGGSIFCTCLVATFIEKMRAIADRADELALEAVVVEASGIADPKVAGQMLDESGLATEFRLANVLSLVDPGTFERLLATLPNLRSQVAAANVIAINKTDRYDADAVARAESMARQINADAAVQHAQFGRIDVDLFRDESVPSVPGEYAQCADPHYTTSVLAFSRPVSMAALRGMIASLGDDLFRAKGTVMTDAGAFDIDASSSGVDAVPIPWQADMNSELVMIAPGEAKSRLIGATAPLAGLARAV